jgi:hypothetical protein
MEAFQIDHFQFHLPVEPSVHRARIHGTFPGYFGYGVKPFYQFENKSCVGVFRHTPLPERETFLHYAKLFPFLSRAAVKLCPFDGSLEARPIMTRGYRLIWHALYSARKICYSGKL